MLYLKLCGLDTVPAFGAGVRPSKNIRGYSTSGVWLEFESLKLLVSFYNTLYIIDSESFHGMAYQV